ncbi:hypothetical protein GCM10009554_39570 [Kribbella koreensis]|uniref:Uncharacterized protein n=2 Tax=Kribbella TaxID=182639 RepID=A0ABP6X3A5_9ACTN
MVPKVGKRLDVSDHPWVEIGMEISARRGRVGLCRYGEVTFLTGSVTKRQDDDAEAGLC